MRTKEKITDSQTVVVNQEEDPESNRLIEDDCNQTKTTTKKKLTM